MITEPTKKENTKSVGCFFIEDSVRKAGYKIEYIFVENLRKTKADIFLFSVHHVKDIFMLERISNQKKNNVWIGGGHVMNNPYPFLNYFDIICIGEGEEWIVNVLDQYTDEKETFIRRCEQMPGTLTKNNQNEIIEKLYISDISQNNKYLNKSHSLGHKDTWYLEIARGCKSKCNYCELGWAGYYRENKKETVLSHINEIQNSPVKRINIFAPDDFSCGFYNECLEAILRKGLITNFGSMRLDNVKDIEIKHKKNFLFRFGVDGLSERLRTLVNKKTENKAIINTISQMAHKGFVMFKFFFIFSYPFEIEDDYQEFLMLMNEIKKEMADLERPIFLRLKFTPFIPNPLTPMQYFKPFYNVETKQKIDLFFNREKYSSRSNIVFINDGILEPFSYYTQTLLARGRTIDRGLIRNRKILNFLSKDMNDFEVKNNIKTAIPEDTRVKAYEKIKREINV